MENFNSKYKTWKQSMIDRINNGGIPLAIVSDFLASLKGEVDRVLMQEEAAAQQEAEAVSLGSESEKEEVEG